MGKRFQFRSIGARLTFWFFIIALFPLIAAGITIYHHMVNTMEASIFNKLEAIRDLKVDDLNHWLEERTIDVRTVAVDEDIRMLEFIREGSEENNQPNIEIAARARDLLSEYLNNYDDLHEIFVVDPQTKIIMVSSDINNEGKKRVAPHHVTESIQNTDVFIEDVHYVKGQEEPHMAFTLPVLSLIDNRSVIGTLVASINLESSLYKLLLNRTGVGKTGETFIVNTDAIALSELRWYENAVLNLKIGARPAVDSSRGKIGIIKTDDYRGEKVLAAYSFIPRTGWGFIAKQDLNEVYAPIDKFRKRTSLFALIIMFAALLIAYHVSKSISNPIQVLQRGTEIIGSGNREHRVGTDAQDEIGRLSRTFDEMIENLNTATASWEELNQEMIKRKHLEKMLFKFREHERRRIGHELHDNLGQQLTAISYKTQALENILSKKSIPEAEDAARITALTEMTKTQVRSLSKELSPLLEKGELSLMTALVELASNSEKLFGIPCTIFCKQPVPLYDESALLHLYRIAQEAITNAARHAKPGKIEIHLKREHEFIELKVKDDGTGFAVAAHLDGMGLEIMKYRASMINAALDLRPDIHNGIIVSCIFRDKHESDVTFSEHIS